jgi:hypothetical protein
MAVRKAYLCTRVCADNTSSLLCRASRYDLPKDHRNSVSRLTYDAEVQVIVLNT